MATKAAKSITINATKYELANALGVADGKLQLKAKDVVLDEVEVKAGASWITLTSVYDFDAGQNVVTAIDCSDDIDPTTYTAMDLYNDWINGDLKVVIISDAHAYLVNQMYDNVDYEGVETHYIKIDVSGTRITNSNDKYVFDYFPEVLVGTDTINLWTTTKNSFTRWEKLCNW